MTAAAPAAPATPSTASWSAVGPFVVFVIGVAAIWLPPRPPMIDLPQFAGQVALLDGLIKGASPWARVVRVDAVTPYLIAYALTVPLSLVLPVVVALKLVLTAAFAGFGLAAAAIRRELGSARQLDAYAFIGFFGYAHGWGLLTFLVAAPLGLLLIWLSLRYARAPTGQNGLIVLAAGAALLFAHGLIFLFATGVGLVLTAVRSGSPKAALRRAWPFALLIAGGAALYLLARGDPGDSSGFGFNFGSLPLRLLGPLGAIDDRPEPWTILALIALLVLPIIGGLKVEIRRLERLLIAAAVFGALALGPDGLWVAAGIFRRFALFAPAAYAWLFSDVGGPSAGLSRLVRPRLGLAASALAGLILAQHVKEAAQFARETKDFDAVMAAARPDQRALGIVIDRSSAADVDLHVYLHFPLWYQAERGGLVDPSFAASPPSIVRYRVNPAGMTHDTLFSDQPDRFDWRRDHGEQWTYFFVRHSAPVPAGLFAGAACPPMLVAARGAWSLFEAAACGAPPS
jgi:hypothetical protein